MGVYRAVNSICTHINSCWAGILSLGARLRRATSLLVGGRKARGKWLLCGGYRYHERHGGGCWHAHTGASCQGQGDIWHVGQSWNWWMATACCPDQGNSTHKHTRLTIVVCPKAANWLILHVYLLGYQILELFISELGGAMAETRLEWEVGWQDVRCLVRSLTVISHSEIMGCIS